MNRFCLLIALLVMPLLAGAAETPRDAQGVPQADVHGRIEVVKPATVVNGFTMPAQRVRLIAVDGKEVPLAEFLRTFCQGKITNETCVRGDKIRRIDNSSGPRELLPKGL